MNEYHSENKIEDVDPLMPEIMSWQSERSWDRRMPATGEGMESGVIYKEKKNDDETVEFNSYQFEKAIAGLHFLFRIYQQEAGGKTFGIWFKTKEYDYATLDLPEGGIEEIFSTLLMLVNRIKEIQDVEKIEIDPSTTTYSKAEIDDARQKLSEKADWSLEEAGRLQGYEVMSALENEHDEVLQIKRNGRQALLARSRLFRMYFKKYFPAWDIEGDNGGSFTLVRKGK